jgi:hypothetical protein
MFDPPIRLTHQKPLFMIRTNVQKWLDRIDDRFDARNDRLETLMEGRSWPTKIALIVVIAVITFSVQWLLWP